MRTKKLALCAAVLAVCSVPLLPSRAEAAPPWVDRHITLPRHDWAFDFGLGVAHYRPNPGSFSRVGMNFEFAVGVVEKLEIGLRTGIRFMDNPRGAPDEYGRLFDRQTFNAGGGIFANPEFRLRGALVKTRPVEVALEGRVYLPIHDSTRFGAMFGVPLMIHIGDHVRLDTGAFIPFYARPDSDPDFALSIPIDVWIQVSRKVALGPLSGMRFWRFGDRPRERTDFDLQLGFGLAYAIASFIDFKTMVYFPDLSDDGIRQFGAGAGLQIRIE
jgi:hypothetical protein